MCNKFTVKAALYPKKMIFTKIIHICKMPLAIFKIRMKDHENPDLCAFASNKI